jgi:ankyrin repeat protein
VNQHYNRALCDAAWDGDVPRIRALIADPEFVRRADPDTALMHASHRGHAKAAELILGGTPANPRARNSEALWRAARYGRGRVVNLLLPLSDTSTWENWQWEELPADMQRRLGRRRARP